MSASIAISTGATTQRREAEEDKSRDFSASIGKFAAMAPLVRTDWWDNQSESVRKAITGRSARSGAAMTYVGTSLDHYHVFAGIFRRPDSRRAVKGHLVVYDTGGMPDMANVFSGLEAARAMIAIASSESLPLWQVESRYFPRLVSNRFDSRDALIHLAKSKPE